MRKIHPLCTQAIDDQKILRKLKISAFEGEICTDINRCYAFLGLKINLCIQKWKAG